MRVSFKVWTSDLKDFQHFALDTDSAQEALLVSNFVHQLRNLFPNNEFQVVKVGKKRYNVLPVPQASA